MENIKKLVLYFLKVFAFVLIVAFIFYLILSFYADKKSKEAFDLWKAEGIDLIQKRNELKETEENDSAKQIIAIGEKLGIKNSFGSSACSSKKEVVSGYLNEQTRKGKLEFLQPDENVEKRLIEIKEDLLKTAAILEKQKPVWKTRKENSFDTPSYLMTIMGLTRLLSAETFYSLSKGQREEAIIFLKAEIALAESLDSKLFTETLIKIACFKYIYACAKFFPYLEEEVESKLLSFDPVECIKEGFVYEAAGSFLHFNSDLKELSAKSSFWLSSFYFKPYLRLDQSQYLKYYLMGMKVAQEQNPCELFKKDISKEIFNKIPKWAVITRIAIPNLQDAWVRAYRLKIEKDIALLALKAKKGKIKNGNFPESLELNKAICPDTSYKYLKNGEAIKIYFDGSFEADEKTAFVPLSWEE